MLMSRGHGPKGHSPRGVDDARNTSEGQLEFVEDGEVGGVWIVGNVVKFEDEEEGTGRGAIQVLGKCSF